MSTNKDVLDHLCATDPHWKLALQIAQLAMKQNKNDPVRASSQVVSALVLLAADTPNPVEFLALCASSLASSPFSKGKKTK